MRLASCAAGDGWVYRIVRFLLSAGVAQAVERVLAIAFGNKLCWFESHYRHISLCSLGSWTHVSSSLRKQTMLVRVLASGGGSFFRNIVAYRENSAASLYVSLDCSLNIEIVFSIWIILSEWSRFFRFSDVHFSYASPPTLFPSPGGGGQIQR